MTPLVAIMVFVALTLAVVFAVRARVREGRAEAARKNADEESERLRCDLERICDEHERALALASAHHEELREAEQSAHAGQIGELRKTTDEKIKLISGNREDLTNEMKALAGDVSKQAVAQLQRAAEESRKTDQTQTAGELKVRNEEVKRVVEPIAKNLEKVQNQVEELERSRKKTEGTVSQMFATVTDEVGKLRIETGQLISALKRPQVRGAWGEMQLTNVVKAANMTEHVDFHTQATIGTADDGRLRPDMTVHLPTERDVVVDAKVPLDAYLAALEADDDQLRDKHLDRHARQLRAHLDSLASKSYQARLDTPAEFAVCFLPNEAVYCAALDRDPGLLEYGAANSVLIATPTTLLALLYACAYGWKQASIEESAREIAAAARELHSRCGKFLDDIAKTGRALGSTVNAYNAAVGSLEGRVLPQLRRFEDVGAGSGKALAGPAPVDRPPRLVTAPELAQDDPDELPPAEAA